MLAIGPSTAEQPQQLREAQILLVDDAPAMRRMLVAALKSDGDTEDTHYVLREAANGVEAQAAIARGEVDIVVTDLKMPHLGGLDLLQWGQAQHPGLTWIILSGLGTLDDAIRAMRLGAFAFVTKTPQMIDSLKITVRNAVRQRWLQAERARFEQELAERNDRLARQVTLLKQQAETIESDLVRAEVIQRALLPAAPPRLGHFAVDAFYRPTHNVGGDLYDVVAIDKRHVAVYVADATGHGVAAAMLAVLFKTHLRLSCEGVPREPAEVLQEVNERLFAELFKGRQAPGMFLTAAYARLDIETGEAVVASAGHPPLLLHPRLDSPRPVRRTGPALGLFPSAQYAQERFVLGPGDRLLLYTDGICQGLEERGPVVARLAEVLADSRLTGQALIRQLVAQGAGTDVEYHPVDDVTVLVLTNSTQPSTFDNGTSGDRDAALAAQPLPALRESKILRGALENRTVVALAGAARWTGARTFYESCMGELRSGRPLLIDLAACPQLDSTVLGTLQEIVAFSIARQVPARLQGLRPEVREQLEELGMSGVLERVARLEQPLPANLTPLPCLSADAAADRARLLLAHEALSLLSEHNRAEFVELIEGLRSELHRGPPPRVEPLATGAE